MILPRSSVASKNRGKYCVNSSIDKVVVVVNSNRDNTSEPRDPIDKRSEAKILSSGEMPIFLTIPFIFLIAVKSAAPNEASTQHGPSFWRSSFGVDVKLVDYDGSCCKKFIEEVITSNKEDFEPVCTECVSSKNNNVFKLDICLGVG